MKAALSNVVQRAPFGLISAPAAMEIMADNEIVLLVFFLCGWLLIFVGSAHIGHLAKGASKDILHYHVGRYHILGLLYVLVGLSVATACVFVFWRKIARRDVALKNNVGGIGGVFTKPKPTSAFNRQYVSSTYDRSL